MKKLLFLIATASVLLVSCHSVAERTAIEKCRVACKYPETFKVKEVKSVLIKAPAEYNIDTVYYHKGEEVLHSDWRKDHLLGYSTDGYRYPNMVSYDSLNVYKIGYDSMSYIQVRVEFTAKNAFGVPSSLSDYFYAETPESISQPFERFMKIKENTFLVDSKKFSKPQKVRNTYDLAAAYTSGLDY